MNDETINFLTRTRIGSIVSGKDMEISFGSYRIQSEGGFTNRISVTRGRDYGLVDRSTTGCTTSYYQTLLKVSFTQIGVVHLQRRTVLHEAMKHRASDAVLGCLVQASIAYDERNNKLMNEIPSLLCRKDECGRTPLHYMIDRITRLLDQGESSRACWNFARILVEACPESAKTFDADGNTPLLLLLSTPKNVRLSSTDSGACEESEEEPFFSILHLMLQLCPDAILPKDSKLGLPSPWNYFFMHQRFEDGKSSLLNGEGFPSPLSCALLHGRSLGTIDLLLNANRKVGLDACRTIVNHFREIPLHIAANMRCSTKILSRLVQEDRAVVGVTDIQGLNPLDWIWIRHILDFCSERNPFEHVVASRRRYMNSSFLNWYKKVSNQYLNNGTSFDSEIWKLLQDDLVKRMMIIIPNLAKIDLRHDDHGDFFLPLLHSSCAVACPLAMVQLCCDSFPEQLKARDKLEKRLPLHWAVCREGYAKRYPVGLLSDTPQYIEEASPASRILSNFPEACRITDRRCQLPLHLAITHVKEQQYYPRPKKRESQDSSISTNDGQENYSIVPEEIKLLLESFPESLTRRDGITKLYPFLLAAEGSSADLDLTYFLLRRDPSLITV